MREIKFRVWDKEDKCMKEVNSINFPMRSSGGKDVTIYNKEEDYYEWVYDYEIMQYIGLKDKNGKEIYEGDILSINGYSYEEPEFSYIGEVKYANQCYCIDDKFDFCELTPIFDIYGSYTTIYEVIGNVYENADMIENFYK